MKKDFILRKVDDENVVVICKEYNTAWAMLFADFFYTSAGNEIYRFARGENADGKELHVTITIERTP